MTIIQITSTNPKLGYLIKKNPFSIPQIKSIKSGFAFGYYTHNEDGTINEQEYNLYFQDQMNNVSYKETVDRESYLDYTDKLRFMSPQGVLELLDTFLSFNMKNPDPQEQNHEQASSQVSHEYKIFINLIWIKKAAYRLFSAALDEICKSTGIISHCEMRSEGVYCLEMISNKSLHFLLNILQTLVVFIIIKNKIYPQIVLDSITAKLKLSLPIIGIHIPYLISYMLLSRMDYKTFNAVVPHLSVNGTKFFYGPLNERRFNFVLTELSRYRLQIDNILDIGSGEGRYLELLNKIKNMNPNNITYNCLDIDDQVINKINKKVASKYNDYKINIIKVSTEHQFEPHLCANLSLNKEQNNVVVMMEVIEHMKVEEAKLLLKNVIKYIPFSRLILSTPNRDFNVNYLIQGFRHDDHKFEFNGEEFTKFITECCQGDQSLTIKYCGIGDVVNDITPTQSVVITKILN
jgi:hypothetical protein